jgi:hypothetical protein
MENTFTIIFPRHLDNSRIVFTLWAPNKELLLPGSDIGAGFLMSFPLMFYDQLVVLPWDIKLYQRLTYL